MKPLSPEEASAVRTLSKTVFGQSERLAVMLAIARDPDGIFRLTDVFQAVGVPNPSAVQGPLNALVAGGFITKVEGRADERARWYRRQQSSMWDLAEEMARSVYKADDQPEGPARRSDKRRQQ